MCNVLEPYREIFIKEEIMEDREITAKKLKLGLKTLTGEKSEEIAAVNDLIVSEISSSKKGPVEKIEVPKAYSRCFLTVQKEEVDTPEKIKTWKYLNTITAEIT